MGSVFNYQLPGPSNLGSQFAAIGQQLGGIISDQGMQSDLKSAINPDGSIDPNKAAAVLLKHNQPAQAAAMFVAGQREGITPALAETTRHNKVMEEQGNLKLTAPKPPRLSVDEMWVDPNDPSKGVQTIPNSAKTQLTPIAAASVAMLNDGDKLLAAPSSDGKTSLRDKLLQPYSASGLGGANPVTYALQDTLNAGDVGRAKRGVRLKVEAGLRLMTGAAAPDTEVARYTDFFMPGPTDSAATAKQKLDALDEFSNSAKANILQGRGGSVPETPGQAPQAAQPTAAQLKLYDTHKNDPAFLAEWNKRFGQ